MVTRKRKADVADVHRMLERGLRAARQVQERSTEALREQARVERATWPARRAEIVAEHSREVNATRSAQAAQRRDAARAEFKASGSRSKKQWAADNHARYGVAFRTVRDWLDGC
jgi:hypothetical protein